MISPFVVRRHVYVSKLFVHVSVISEDSKQSLNYVANKGYDKISLLLAYMLRNLFFFFLF